jgi:ribosomal protein S18 acetylase RimI-like enzyme
MIVVTTVTGDDNLRLIVSEINSASWDQANEMSAYDTEGLAAYLRCQDAMFLACHDVVDGRRTLLGMAAARLQTKPYGKERWLYVDEVDVCADQRRRGAGTALMKELLAIAEQAGCTEVWLGADVNNVSANALYRSLGPDDVAHVVGYTYENATRSRHRRVGD